jgi:choline dehydrogenase-like flavoprotein
MGAYTAYPYSRGSIHITDPNDLNDGYEFDTGFLNHPSDIKKQLWAYKLTREIARNLPYYRGELGLGHPKFPEGSQAALLADLSLSGPNPHLNTASSAPGALPKLQYTTEDDAAIEDWIRTNLNTTWHSCGTCAMKPFDKGGVLDGDLNVFGTRGLKVADLSITPENVGANTNNTALAVGEKAAVIIGRELGIEV